MTEREIFLATMETDDPAERMAYLDEACGADALLRHRIEALLRAHDGAADFMEAPVVEQLVGNGEGLDFLSPSQKPGSLGRLGYYEVLAVVGRGGMGVVFRAFDAKLHRVVAIKALAPQLALSSAARERFVREARAAAAVTHDHVIAIHTVEDTEPVPYLVMQFIDGPTLQKKLDRTGQLSLKEILRISLQIAEGLAAAHRQGLVHRDVKPANILLENGVERVKITDFGLARAGGDASLTHLGAAQTNDARADDARADDDPSLTQSGIAGTPMYMSPEQAQGGPVDFRSDLFSLGSVLYAMCTGRAPFRASSPMGTLKRVCEETPRPIREINPELPPWLGELVARLHAKSPADRFASAQEVADLLARHLAELQRGGAPSPPTPLPAADTPAVTGPPRRRHRWVAAAVLPLALLAGLGLSEATGVTDVRGMVLRLFEGEGTRVSEGDGAPLPQAVSPPAGLVGWWRGEGDAYDVRGSHHGKLVGEVSYARGQVGRGFHFPPTGVNQVEVAGTPDLDLTTAVTLEAWINPSLAFGHPYGAIIARTGEGTRNYGLFVSSTGGLLLSYINESGSPIDLHSVANLVPEGQFSHVAGVIDTAAGAMYIYVNGQAAASRNAVGPMVPNTLPLTIGQGFQGLIDEPAVYNRALSQSQIQAIVNAGSAGKFVPVAAPAGLVSWWRAEDNADDVRGSHHGMLVGEVSYAPGQVGRGFRFPPTGINQVEVDSTPDLDLTTAVTLEAWINPSSLANGYGGIINKGGDHTRNYGLLVRPDGGLLLSYINQGGKGHLNLETVANLVPVGQFSHVAGVIDTAGNVMHVYVNGQVVATRHAGGPMVPNTLPLTIGRADGTSPGLGFQGLIDEPAVYNRALSQGEIQALVNAGSVGKRVPVTGDGQKTKAP
jgi:serine/threonine protein kinase